MTPTDLNALAIAWRTAKLTEKEAIEQRREIEDKLTAALAVNLSDEGVQNMETMNYNVKITNRFTRKVDAELIQEIAAEHGISHLLSSVCRWTPELDMRAWRGLDEKTRHTLARAVTTKASRPSFDISTKE